MASHSSWMWTWKGKWIMVAASHGYDGVLTMMTLETQMAFLCATCITWCILTLSHLTRCTFTFQSGSKRKVRIEPREGAGIPFTPPLLRNHCSLCAYRSLVDKSSQFQSPAAPQITASRPTYLGHGSRLNWIWQRQQVRPRAFVNLRGLNYVFYRALVILHSVSLKDHKLVTKTIG